MKRLVRISALLLAALLLICAVSCGTAGTETDTTAAVAETDAPTEPAAETDKYEIGDLLNETYDFKDETIVIASRGRQWTADEVAVEAEMGDLINDAIFKRNLSVENRLKIKIDNYLMTPGTDNYEIAELIKTQVKSGLDDYDLICASVYASIISTAENIYYDLKELNALDLSRPYWSQGFNDAASFGNSQFFATGAICLSYYRFIFATFFNRAMFDASGDAYLYEPVRNHEWTLEYQYQLAEKFYSDLNGDQKADDDDIYGFVTNDYIGVDPYWSSLKLPILVKNADNYFSYAVDTARTADAVTAINKLYWSNPGTHVIAHAAGDSEQETIAAKFATGTAAMCTLRLIEVEGTYLRNMTQDYGIVPMPMLNKDQDNYYSYAHDTMSGYAVPNTRKTDEDFQRLGVVMEAMASASYREVVPEYYEVSLKTKYVNDPDSVDMLDRITENVYLDPGVLYTKKINSVHQEMRNFIGNKEGNVASRLKIIGTMASKLTETLNDDLSSVDN